MRLMLFTYRGKAIFNFPSNFYLRCFSTFSRKSNHNSSLQSYIDFHARPCSVSSFRSSSGSNSVLFLQWNSGFASSRCISSVSSSAASTVEWNDAVPHSEIGGRVKAEGLEEEDEMDEASKAYIPVRAYFFSTSVDLKRLVEQNKNNFIPPSSRMTNYVVLRFGDLKPDPAGHIIH